MKRGLKALAKRLLATYRVIHEEPRLERMWPAGTPEPLTDKNVVRGPDDGRMEKQVELFWDVTDFCLRALQSKVSDLELHTAHVWESHGVSVL
jgi:hypothetical protein